MYRCESWTIKKAERRRIDALNCGVGEDSWESLGPQGDPTSPFWRRSALNIHWKDWCWSWSSNTSATWYEEQTHWKRPWCWKIEVWSRRDDREWDGWMASPTQWTWVWVNSRRWWRTGKPGVLQSMGLQRVGYDLTIEQQQSRYCVKTVWILILLNWFMVLFRSTTFFYFSVYSFY